MKKYQVAVVVGSLRKESLNQAFADALVKLAPEDVSFTFAPIGTLPLYNQDEDVHPPEAANAFKAIIQKSQAVLFVTPLLSHKFSQIIFCGETAGCFSGGLNNSIKSLFTKRFSCNTRKICCNELPNFALNF